jgi:CBS domain
VADVMDAEPVAVPEELPASRALDEYFLRYRWPWFPVVDAGERFRGLLVREAADGVPELSRATQTVGQVFDLDASGALRVRDDAPLESLLGNDALRRLGGLAAVDADGRLRGVITADQVGRGFRFVQFPFNIVERSAVANGWLDRCRALGLVTMGNRPLSVRTAAGPLRIADAPPSPTSASEDLIAELDTLEPGLDWLVDNWAHVLSSDALDYVEGLVWSQVSPTSSATTSHRLRELFAARRLELRHTAAEQTRALLASQQLAVSLDDPGEPIAVGACRANLDHVDHILVGLRTSADVDQLGPLLTVPARTSPPLREAGPGSDRGRAARGTRTAAARPSVR